MAGRRWKAEEIEQLRTQFHGLSDSQLGIRLGRTEMSVMKKRRYLGLRKALKEYEWQNKMPIKMLTLEQRCYLAGLVDGEGTISITKDKRRRLMPKLKVYNNSLNLLKKVREWLGKGHIYYGYKGHHSGKVFELTMLRDIHSLLNQIGDYLILKNRHHEILMEFCERRLNSFSIDQKDYQLHQEIKTLNAKGQGGA